jgi:monoamine oxidase
VEIFRQRLVKQNVSLRTNMVVKRITWSPGTALIDAEEADNPISFRARKVLVTVPLGVLQAPVDAKAAIEFRPALPAEKLGALTGLEMGKVIRVVLSFRERFWNQIAPDGNRDNTLAGMSFLFSQDDYFPTWWTTMPDRVPIITGWAPFQSAERVTSGDTSPITRALQTLSGVLKVETEKLEVLLDRGYFHDWQSDPYSLGAYSYAKAGGGDAPEILGRPMDNTVFFAGEATDILGNNGTVHGAIASGRRAAAEILRNEKNLSRR